MKDTAYGISNKTNLKRMSKQLCVMDNVRVTFNQLTWENRYAIQALVLAELLFH